jgi:hypothetical protein
MKWLRLYDDLLDDPKAQQLAPVLFKHWINLLCLASKSEPRGTLPAITDVAFRLRVTSQKARTILNELASVGMIDAEGETFQMHNWSERQRESDNVAARVRKHREGVTRNEDVTLQKRECNALDTDTDTDTDTEPLTPRGNEPDSGFETFWSLYPRKEDRKGASRSWSRVRKADHAAIMADIQRRLDTGQWVKGSQFIPIPTTYLNRERWTDEIPAAITPAVPDRVAEAIAERERLLRGDFRGQTENLEYRPKLDGPENLARRIAELDRIITGAVAA